MLISIYNLPLLNSNLIVIIMLPKLLPCKHYKHKQIFFIQKKTFELNLFLQWRENLGNFI